MIFFFLWAVPPSPGSPQFCYLQTTDHTPILTHYKGSLGSKQSSSPGFIPSTSTSGSWSAYYVSLARRLNRKR